MSYAIVLRGFDRRGACVEQKLALSFSSIAEAEASAEQLASVLGPRILPSGRRLRNLSIEVEATGDAPALESQTIAPMRKRSSA